MSAAIIGNVVLWLIPFFIFIFFCVIPSSQYKRTKTMLAARGLLKIAEEDFSYSEPCFEDRVRVGERFVYPVSGGDIIFISSLSKMKIVKTVYTGDRSGTKWSYMLTEHGKNIQIFHTEESETNYQREWERLAEKLSALNPELIVDRNIETKFVRVVDPGEPLDSL